MANILPYLRATSGTLNAQVLYGFTRVISCLTTVQQFDNGSEQRWVSRTPLANFKIPMGSLSPADKAQWLTFFNTTKGRLSQDLELTLGATTYSNLTSQSDDLSVTNRLALAYDQEITLRQVYRYPYTVPTVGSSYPLLAFGTGGPIASSERPLVQVSSYLTDVNDSPYGQRFAFGWYGTGQANFPTSYLRAWHISYPLLTDADSATIETYFLGNQGRYATFDYTDPIDNTVYHNVRFDHDDLAFKYIAPNQQQTQVVLKQIWT